ncbi:MAG TPA: rRNA maturation RNase YbeY, partial [bacterium]|nr:rRNA maturation RNase YbeY [bacterium]
TAVRQKNVCLINLQRKVHINCEYLNKAFELLEGKLDTRLTRICITIVSDSKIKQLNKKFLNKNYPTDVLAFHYGKTGDIIISAETAQVQAFEMSHTLEEELLYLIVHGILHLNGYDDTHAKSYEKMKKKQDAIFTEISGSLNAKR